MESVLRGHVAINAALTDVLACAIVDVCFGREVAGISVHATIYWGNAGASTIRLDCVEDGILIAVIASVADGEAGAVVGVCCLVVVACVGVGAAWDGWEAKGEGDLVSIVRIFKGRKNSALRGGEDHVTIHIASAPNAAIQAIAIRIRQDQLVATFTDAPGPFDGRFILPIVLALRDIHENGAIGCHDAPTRFFWPAIRGDGHHDIRARVFTTAIVDGRISIVIQRALIRATRHKRRTIGGAKHHSIRHGAVEREIHIVAAVGGQIHPITIQRPLQRKTSICKVHAIENAFSGGRNANRIGGAKEVVEACRDRRLDGHRHQCLVINAGRGDGVQRHGLAFNRTTICQSEFKGIVDVQSTACHRLIDQVVNRVNAV